MKLNCTNFTRFLWCVSLLTVLISVSSFADPSKGMTEAQFSSLRQHVMSATPDLGSFSSVADVNQYLAQFSQPHATMIKHIWLQRLKDSSANVPSHAPVLRRWVDSEKLSNEVIQVEDSGHRHVALTVVNIKASVNTLIQLWQYQARAQIFAARFQVGQVDWPERFTDEDEQGFLLWLQTLNPDEAKYVAEDYLSHYQGKNPTSDNRVLYHLAQRSGDVELWRVLISQPVDQFSYSAVAHIRQFVDDADALALLDSVLREDRSNGGAKSSRLASTALMTLARDYSSNPQAQTLFMQSALSTDYAWLAAAAAAKVQDQDFREKLAVFYTKHKIKSASFALQTLQTVHEQEVRQ